MQRADGDQREGGRQAGTRAPRVWLVVGEKVGDNAQILNLARAVGWDFEQKKIFVKPRWATRKPIVRPSLGHIDRGRSDPLEPPWPDLVITAGRRLSRVGLWIKRASGGRTKLVMIGKPRRLLDSVDLIVAAAHYNLADRPNVVRHDLPLMHVDPGVLERAAARWQPRLAGLRRPLTALFVGGSTGGQRFGLEAGRTLFDRTLEAVRAEGGSLYVTTSRRTPPAVVEMLREACPADAVLHIFDPDAPPEENPYHALLALADHFVVTTDSISMMVEVARLGRPLSLSPLDREPDLQERVRGGLGAVLARLRSAVRGRVTGSGPSPGTHPRSARSRDLSAIPRLLVEQGRASWLGDPRVEPPPLDDRELETIAARIRGLLDGRSALGDGGL